MPTAVALMPVGGCGSWGAALARRCRLLLYGLCLQPNGSQLAARCALVSARPGHSTERWE
jgi:hypothetical protein